MLLVLLGASASFYDHGGRKIKYLDHVEKRGNLTFIKEVKEKTVTLMKRIAKISGVPFVNTTRAGITKTYFDAEKRVGGTELFTKKMIKHLGERWWATFPAYFETQGWLEDDATTERKAAITKQSPLESSIAHFMEQLNSKKDGFKHEDMKKYFFEHHKPLLNSHIVKAKSVLPEVFNAKELKYYDSDKSRTLSKDELKNPEEEGRISTLIITGGMAHFSIPENFDAADTNKDAELTVEEMKEHHEQNLDEHWFADAKAENLVHGYDANKDGIVTAGEIETSETKRALLRHLMQHDEL